MMTRGGEGGKKCPKFDDVICERPLINDYGKTQSSLETRAYGSVSNICSNSTIGRFALLAVTLTNQLSVALCSLRNNSKNLTAFYPIFIDRLFCAL